MGRDNHNAGMHLIIPGNGYGYDPWDTNTWSKKERKEAEIYARARQIMKNPMNYTWEENSGRGFHSFRCTSEKTYCRLISRLHETDFELDFCIQGLSFGSYYDKLILNNTLSILCKTEGHKCLDEESAIFRCPYCGSKNLMLSKSGFKIWCDSCGHLIDVPSPADFIKKYNNVRAYEHEIGKHRGFKEEVEASKSTQERLNGVSRILYISILDALISNPDFFIWKTKTGVAYITYTTTDNEGHEIMLYCSPPEAGPTKIIVDGIAFSPPLYDPDTLKERLVELVEEQKNGHFTEIKNNQITEPKTNFPSIETKNVLFVSFQKRCPSCMSSNLKVIDISFPIVDICGNIVLVPATTSYCEKCDIFILDKQTYENIHIKGSVMCRVLNRNHADYNISSKIKNKSRPEEMLREYGYGGGNEKQNRKILDILLGEGIFSKRDLINCIDFYIKENKRKHFISVSNSISLKKDREYILNF